MSGALTPLWASNRQRGSFRGVPFVVLTNSFKRGRQQAMHTYPYRDDPWPEDLGRSPRVTSFRGFVNGDDADSQMQTLIAAVEQPGPGLLVHPVLGSILSSVLSFSIGDDPSRGRMWSFEMTTVPYIQRIYPVAVANTQATTQGFFGSLKSAVASDFQAVSNTVNQVRSAVSGVVQTVSGYVAQGESLIHDATALAHIPAQLAGNFGRFASGGLSLNIPGAGVVASFAQASGTVNGAIANVSNIGRTLGSLASKL